MQDPITAPDIPGAIDNVANVVTELAGASEATQAQIEAINDFLTKKQHPDDTNHRWVRRASKRAQLRRDKLANLDRVRNTVAKSRNTLPDAREQYRIEQARKRLNAAAAAKHTGPQLTIDGKVVHTFQPLTQAHSEPTA